jgi:tripartite ATP-independent transporter DctP family solute receptor
MNMKLGFTMRRALIAAAVFTACGAALAQTVQLKLGHGAALDNPRHIASLKFADLVKAKTNGRLEVAVSPSAQLGTDPAMITALRTGALDITANSQGAVSSTVPEYNAFGMPFLFADVGAAFKVMDGPVGKELAAKTEEKGMIVLGYWDNGIRQMTNSKRPLNNPADLNGLKMRTPPDAVTMDIMKAVGATPQQIAFSELYVALQQGVVDGQENPLANIFSAKLYEVNKYISMTGHKYEMSPFLMSKRTWEKLSAADQKSVMDSALEATTLQRKLSMEADQKLVAELKAKGAIFNNANKAAFEKATSNVDDIWMAKSDIGPFVKKVIAAARAK